MMSILNMNARIMDILIFLSMTTFFRKIPETDRAGRKIRNVMITENLENEENEILHQHLRGSMMRTSIVLMMISDFSGIYI